MALKAPDAFEIKSDVITAYLLKKVLMVPTPVDEVCYTLSFTSFLNEKFV